MDTYTLSTDLSVILTVAAAVMWGSWMIITKFKKDYPLPGIVFWMYTFSFVLIGALTLIFSPAGFFEISKNNASVIFQIILSGGIMSLGLYFNLQVIGATGLLLATAISSAATNILGIFTSMLTEGMPERTDTLLLFVFVTLLFVAGGFVCNSAALSHGRDIGADGKKNSVSLKILLFAIVSGILINGWAMGTSIGTANSIPPVITCFYLSLGSFLSILIVCGVTFTRKKQWHQILCAGKHAKLPLILGGVAAICHYGGNFISIFSMPALSATLSFLITRIYPVVTIVWGLLFKEFKGSKTKTILLLCAGLALNFLALVLLGIYTFSK